MFIKGKEVEDYSSFHLEYLAVDEKYQRRGIGSILLEDLSEKIREISEKINCFRGLTLNPITDQLHDFYKNNCFNEINVKSPEGLTYFWIDFKEKKGG